MNNCKECNHAEMCKWIDELDGRGCDFYDGKSFDTISRAEALDQLEQAYNIMDATDRVKAMPSVQPSHKECRTLDEFIEDMRGAE